MVVMLVVMVCERVVMVVVMVLVVYVCERVKGWGRGWWW